MLWISIMRASLIRSRWAGGIDSGRGALLPAQYSEPAFLAIGIDHEKAVVVFGIFDFLTLNEQAPTVPRMLFLRGIDGVIALDREDVRIDGGRVRSSGAFGVHTAAYR